MSSIDKDANSVEDRGPNELSGARRPLPPGAKGFLWLCVLIAIGIISFESWRWHARAPQRRPLCRRS